MEVYKYSDGVIVNVGGSNLSTGEVCVFNIVYAEYQNKHDEEQFKMIFKGETGSSSDFEAEMLL